MPTRRHFLIGTAAAAAAARCVQPVSAQPVAAAQLQTHLDGKPVSQTAIASWELRRTTVAAARLARDHVSLLRGELDALQRNTIGVAGLPAARLALARARAAIGAGELRAMLTAEAAASGIASRAAVTASAGQWAVSSVGIVSSRGSAQGFASWFRSAHRRDDRAIWTDACPDHYLITTNPDGRQEVIEVTGGAVLASRFFVSYADQDRVVLSASPAYSQTIAGTAALASGEIIGSVCHQFRDEPGDGFRAQLRVAFPAALPRHNILEHQWHLACEFGNWITAYLQ